MTHIRITDEEYGRFCRRSDELTRAVIVGAISFEAGMDGLRRLVAGTDDYPLKKEGFEPRIWPTEVDYATPIDEQIKSFGKRIRVDLRVPWLGDEYFPSTGGTSSAVLNMEFVAFKQPVPLAKSPMHLAKHGYRGLTAHELVGFAVTHDRLRPQNPIAAVGQVMRHVSGNHYVACLEAAGDVEAFNVLRFADGIALDCFLAVKA